MNKILRRHKGWIEVDVSTAKRTAVMKIDETDYDSLRARGCGRIWAALDRSGMLYACCSLNGQAHRIHRLLIPDHPVVDHINHDGLDNRRCKIRGCTQSQNSMNRRKRKDNSSGVTGIFHLKKVNRWKAFIRVDGKLIHLGRFDTKSEAVIARKAGENKHFGEYNYKGER